MKEIQFEKISALIDGELPDAEANKLLDQILSDDDLLKQWESLCRARDSISPDVEYHLSADFVKSVSTEVASDVTVLMPESPSSKGNVSEIQVSTWGRPLAGFAIAASIAAVTFLGVSLMNSDRDPVTSPPASTVNRDKPSDNPLKASIQVAAASPGTYWVGQTQQSRNSKLESRLNLYLSDHIESAVAGSIQGMLPYSKLVAFDGARQ